ncbi:MULTISPECIES: hypothetical protein [unclassified Bradyrhizobium]|uniref:hypothetical protein n=1 Tax=unclassified Bradyrhizobium TaxID=2631580 RepID=UPI003392CBE5
MSSEQALRAMLAELKKLLAAISTVQGKLTVQRDRWRKAFDCGRRAVNARTFGDRLAVMTPEAPK